MNEGRHSTFPTTYVSILRQVIMLMGAVGLVAGQPMVQQADGQGGRLFVEVSGTQFRDADGTPFQFVGTNFYPLTQASFYQGFVPEGTEPQERRARHQEYVDAIHQTMADYKTAGVTVVRFWAVSCAHDRHSPRHPGGNMGAGAMIQKGGLGRPYNTGAMDRLRIAVQAARAAGVKLVMPFINFEHEFCGMEWFVEEVLNITSPRECQSEPKGKECKYKVNSYKHLFYTSPQVQAAFMAHVAYLLSFEVDGVPLGRNPAFLAFEAANEPHTADNVEKFSFYYASIKADYNRIQAVHVRARSESDAATLATYNRRLGWPADTSPGALPAPSPGGGALDIDPASIPDSWFEGENDVIPSVIAHGEHTQVAMAEDVASFVAAHGLVASPGTIVNSWLNRLTAFLRNGEGGYPPLMPQGDSPLIASGEEGYTYIPGDPHWLNNGLKGVDFSMNVRLPMLDYMTAHYYPVNWKFGWFVDEIVAKRAELAHSYGKPIVIEETGASNKAGVITQDGREVDLRVYSYNNRGRFISLMGYHGARLGYAGVMTWGMVIDRTPAARSITAHESFLFSHCAPEAKAVHLLGMVLRGQASNYPLCQDGNDSGYEAHHTPWVGGVTGLLYAGVCYPQRQIGTFSNSVGC